MIKNYIKVQKQCRYNWFGGILFRTCWIDANFTASALALPLPWTRTGNGFALSLIPSYQKTSHCSFKSSHLQQVMKEGAQEKCWKLLQQHWVTGTKRSTIRNARSGYVASGVNSWSVEMLFGKRGKLLPYVLCWGLEVILVDVGLITQKQIDDGMIRSYDFYSPITFVGLQAHFGVWLLREPECGMKNFPCTIMQNQEMQLPFRNQLTPSVPIQMYGQHGLIGLVPPK